MYDINDHSNDDNVFNTDDDYQIKMLIYIYIYVYIIIYICHV